DASQSELKAIIAKLTGPTVEIGTTGNIRQGLNAITPDKAAFGTPFNKDALKDYQEVASDISIINDYWYKYSQIQATAATATENTRRVMELQEETAKQLRDPSKYADVIGKWRALEEERVLAAKSADERIKTGEASLL